MAGFGAHLSTSAILGAGYGAAAHSLFGAPVSTCILAGGLFTASGLLPDVDSNTGHTLREGTTFAAAVVPMILLGRLVRLGLSAEWIVLASAAIYLVIRFGLAQLICRVTTHRGMLHSIPAAVIAGELAFLLIADTDMTSRLFKSGAVFLGYTWHLVLDELAALGVVWTGPKVKRSFGTALKMFGRSAWANVFTYAQLIVLTYILIGSPPTSPRDAVGRIFNPTCVGRILNPAIRDGLEIRPTRRDGLEIRPTRDAGWSPRYMGGVSSSSVTGPSLTSSTSMCWRKRPVATAMPCLFTTEQKAS